MYTPAHTRWNDEAQLRGFMRNHPFATVVTAVDGHLEITHIPVLVEKGEDALVLSAHMARANPHARLLGRGRTVIVFSQPHAYVSPALYAEPDVPTWNYMAVHAEGTVDVLEDHAEALEAIRRLMAANDADHERLWAMLDQRELDDLVRGVVAFRIHVTALQGKAKLSQNRPTADRASVKEHLERSDDPLAREIGHHIRP